MTRRVMRAFCAAAALAATLAPGADASHAPSLAGETVIEATRTSKMRVYLPTRARIAIDTSTHGTLLVRPSRFWV